MEGDILWGVDPERDRRLGRSALTRYLSAVGLALLLFLLAARSTSLPVSLVRWYWQGHGIQAGDSAIQLVNMASYIFSLLVPLLFFVLFQGPRKTKVPLFPLGLPRRGVLFPALGICLGACSLSNYFSNWISLLIQRALPDVMPVYRADIPSQGAPMLLGLISAAVLPAIFEELLFRGAILQGARPFGDGFAILVSALAFTLCHTTVPQLAPALAAGLLFGFFTVASGSLLVPILIHCCYNLLASAVELAGTVGGPSLQRTVSLSISGGSLLLCLAGCVLLYLRFREKTLVREYRGPLTTGDRITGLVTSLPLLAAVGMLCWTTWEPLLKGAAGR